MTRQAVSGSFEYQATATTTLSIGAGVGTGGTLVVPGERRTISPGWLASAAYARRLGDGQGPLPFVILGLSLGGSGARTRLATLPSAGSSPFYAFDFRVGITVGKTFLEVLTPYAAARLFAGPVIWAHGGTTSVGTDQNHYQLAAGFVVSLPRGFDAFAEAAPFGERVATFGGGLSF